MSLTSLPPARDPEFPVRFAHTLPEVSDEGTRTVVSLRDESDTSTRWIVSHVLLRVMADRTGDVVIDLSESTFIDPAIVRTMASVQRFLQSRDRTLTFRSPSRLAARLIQAFGMAALIEPEPPTLR